MLPYNDNIAIVTAGSPRPGGRKLRARLKDVEHLRFVHGNDIVPLTPPFLAGFVHTHPVIHLEDENDTMFDGVALITTWEIIMMLQLSIMRNNGKFFSLLSQCLLRV